MNAPITSADISDAAASKPLGKFGCKLVRRPVSQGRAQADMDAADPVTPSRKAA